MEEYNKYSKTDYYWVLEFLNSDYERSSYKKNGADIILKMNDAKNIKELLNYRREIHNFIENNRIGEYLINNKSIYPLTPKKMDIYFNRCFNGNIVRLIEELPNKEESIDKALKLYVNSYYIEPTTDIHITKALQDKFGNSIIAKMINVQGLKTKYWDCLIKLKDNISYPEGSNGRKKLLHEHKQLQKGLKKYGYIRHIYDLSDSNISEMIIGMIVVMILLAIFIAIGGFFGIAVIIWVIGLVFAQATGRRK